MTPGASAGEAALDTAEGAGIETLAKSSRVILMVSLLSLPAIFPLFAVLFRSGRRLTGSLIGVAHAISILAALVWLSAGVFRHTDDVSGLGINGHPYDIVNGAGKNNPCNDDAAGKD